MNKAKQVLLQALDEVERFEDETRGELRDLVVAYSVQSDSGDIRIGWSVSNAPCYAIVGLLGEVVEGLTQQFDWVEESDDEED